MFDGQYAKYANDEQFYQDMMAWLEMEHEMSEKDIKEMERDLDKSLTSKNPIVSKTPVNNQDYNNTNIGA
ncbi:hypothetical protein ACKGJI_08855 [Sulfurospirillum sp. 1307]